MIYTDFKANQFISSRYILLTDSLEITNLWDALCFIIALSKLFCKINIINTNYELLGRKRICILIHVRYEKETVKITIICLL